MQRELEPEPLLRKAETGAGARGGGEHSWAAAAVWTMTMATGSRRMTMTGGCWPARRQRPGQLVVVAAVVVRGEVKNVTTMMTGGIRRRRRRQRAAPPRRRGAR